MEDPGFIAVMGMTGSGKTTFISRLTGLQSQAGVGHSLSSSTINTACHMAVDDHGRKVCLIDTPGFDDTTRPDAEILKTIANELSRLWQDGRRLLGIIFLHRITDVRLTNSAIKHFNILQLLCGPENYDRVVLATTMWGDAMFSRGGEEAAAERKNAAVERQEKLQEYWKDMFQGKSELLCHYDTPQSAWEIVHSILDRLSTKHLPPLRIQRELAIPGTTMDETEAGRYVSRELLEAKERLDRQLVRLQEELEHKTRRRDEEALNPLGGVTPYRHEGWTSKLLSWWQSLWKALDMQLRPSSSSSSRQA